MDTKAIISVLFAAVMGLIGWNIKTTNSSFKCRGWRSFF